MSKHATKRHSAGRQALVVAATTTSMFAAFGSAVASAEETAPDTKPDPISRAADSMRSTVTKVLSPSQSGGGINFGFQRGTNPGRPPTPAAASICSTSATATAIRRTTPSRVGIPSAPTWP